MPRFCLSDTQWTAVAPLLPGKPSDPGRSGADNRLALEGILWIMRTGAPWRDLPPTFGKWNSVYQRFKRWERAGVFQRIFASSSPLTDPRSVQVDGTYIKVHQHGSGAVKVVARPVENTPMDPAAAGAPPS